MRKLNLKSGLRFATPKKIAIGAIVVFIFGLMAFQFQYLAEAARIEQALVVEPQSINFGFVLPAVSQEQKLAVSLSVAWLQTGRTEPVAYFVAKNLKCKTFTGDGIACVEYYPDLCPLLSLNPEQGALAQANPTGSIGVVLNAPGGVLPPELQNRRFWCDLWVQVGTASSTPPSPLARLFESFPIKTAHAFEAHIVDISAVFLAGSPAQVAVAPAVATWFQAGMKTFAIQVSLSRHDPLTNAALATQAVATAVLCLAPEPSITKVLCLGQILILTAFKDDMWNSFDLLAHDPPREDFNVAERIKPTKPVKPFDNSAFAEATARYATSLSRQAQLVDAVRITNERLQGAVLADKGEYMLLQSRLLSEFLGRLAESNTHHQEIIKQLLHQLPKAWNESVSQRVASWASEGLSDEEKQALLAGGLSEEDIAKIEEIFRNASGVEQGDYFGTLQAGLEKEIELMQNALPAIEESAKTLKEVVGVLEGIVCTGQSQPNVCL